MTVRSAATERPSERPKVSFVFAVHDPEYGGGLLGRTQLHLDALIELANRYQLLSEIIVVEWNPRQDRVRFRESLRWPDDLGYVCLRFIEVPEDVHRTFPNADRLPIFEYIAKNAGLRRARGQFLLATNPDLFFSPALMRWLARASLSSERFYRVDRRDLSEDIPADRNLARQLRFCSRHVAEVHAFFGSYRPGNADVRQRLSEEYHHRIRDTAGATRWTNTPDARLLLPADALHRNAAGDFFLMAREWWHRLRGYPELYTHAHIDAILCWVAASAGLAQEILPPRCHLYHQAHHRADRMGFPPTDWKPWYKRYQEAVRTDRSGEALPMVVNLPNWGLADTKLPEWQASPALVQVPAFASRVDDEATRFENSIDPTDSEARAAGQTPTEAERSLATLQSDLQHAQVRLDAAGQKEAALRAVVREERSAREVERAAAEDVLRKARRAHKAEQAALKAALHEAKVAHRAEAAARRTLESSTAWRITGPIRRTLAAFPRLRHTLQRSLRLRGIERGMSPGRELSVVTPKNDSGPTSSQPPDPAREVARQASPVDTSTPKAMPDATPTLSRLLSQRFRELAPLRVFTVPGDAPRLSLVTDSLSASSLFGGVATALVTSALLARHLGTRLRVITLKEPGERGNVAAVLNTHRIQWTADIEFVDVGPGHKEEVAIGDHELFITTSWRGTRCVLPIVDPSRLVYLLLEDERTRYAWGDDRLRCVETLSDSNIRFVITSQLLFEHLTQGPEALPNILTNGVWFEPAFPALDHKVNGVDRVGKRRHFLFYSRPDHRSMYWRGLEAIGAALEEGVLDPATWTFHLAGGDVRPIELPRGVRPNIVQSLPWSNHASLVRGMDVGLCLMDAPYPSYPLLDLAASGAVVVTNHDGRRGSLAGYSNLIISSASSIKGLTHGIAEAAARAVDRDRRQADLDGDHINRDWEAAVAPVLARLCPICPLG